jgi:beta-glucosidase
VSVTVTNAGRRAGDEVVQLYITDPAGSVQRPLKELKDFRRITLAPGERRQIKFVLTPDRLASLDEQMRHTVAPGSYQIMVGPSSVKHQTAKLEVVAK